MGGARDDSCRLSSLAAQEPLGGTAAAETDFWILIECGGYWAPKILEDDHIDPALRATLRHAEATIPTARIQFIKPLEPTNDSHRQVFVVDARHGHEPTIYAGAFEDCANLAGTDWTAFRRGEPPQWANVHEAPLLLICTHGKRDPCCARFGLELGKRVPASHRHLVWQTSHLGGHRFAPTAVVFPHGYCYGRLTPEEAPPLLDAIQKGELYRLDRLRGWTALSRPGQLAEITWRQLRADVQPGSIRVERIDVLDDNLFRVHLQEADGAERAQFEIHARMSETPLIKSCGKDPEPVLRVVVAPSVGTSA